MDPIKQVACSSGFFCIYTTLFIFYLKDFTPFDRHVFNTTEQLDKGPSSRCLVDLRFKLMVQSLSYHIPHPITHFFYSVCSAVLAFSSLPLFSQIQNQNLEPPWHWGYFTVPEAQFTQHTRWDSNRKGVSTLREGLESPPGGYRAKKTSTCWCNLTITGPITE